MNIPEFTAQSSLYRTSNRYRSLAFDGASTLFVPQLMMADPPFWEEDGGGYGGGGYGGGGYGPNPGGRGEDLIDEVHVRGDREPWRFDPVSVPEGRDPSPRGRAPSGPSGREILEDSCRAN